MARLFLDIETLPVPPELRETFLSTVKPPPEDEEERQAAVAESSLHAEFGRILCVGYWKEPDMRAPDVLTGEEPEILRHFWDLARDARPYIGHNVLDFDLPFLVKRSIIHRIRPLPISFARYRSDAVFDTMREWSHWSTRERVSLDTLAKVLGLPTSKAAMDGSKVAEYHAAGRDAEIHAYCKEDVRLTRDVYRRMAFEA